MATYIVLPSWTQQGIETITESPTRLDAAKQAFRDMGGEVKAFYLLLGRYDTVLVVEAPNDASVAKALLADLLRATEVASNGAAISSLC